jgi:hypothetical protein
MSLGFRLHGNWVSKGRRLPFHGKEERQLKCQALSFGFWVWLGRIPIGPAIPVTLAHLIFVSSKLLQFYAPKTLNVNTENGVFLSIKSVNKRYSMCCGHIATSWVMVRERGQMPESSGNYPVWEINVI